MGDVTRKPTDDDWCDWCGKAILAAPFRFDERVFCGLSCITKYRQSAAKPDAGQ